MSDLEALVFDLIEKYMSGGTDNLGGPRYHERHALVTSYDPDKYLAKAVIMPEGQETGWIPVETGHIGDSYGVAFGLQPGDGKTTGDQVILRYQEGDLSSAKIVQRVHSDADKPPTVQSGEMVIWTKLKKSTGNSGLGDDQSEGGAGGDNDEAQSGQGGSGQQFYLKNDGSLTITDGNGATTVMDGKGNITITSTSGTVTVNSKGDTTVNSQADILVNAQGSVTTTAPTINEVGETHLGAPGGLQIARKGTIDTGGFADMLNLSPNVFST